MEGREWRENLKPLMTSFLTLIVEAGKRWKVRNREKIGKIGHKSTNYKKIDLDAIGSTN